MQIRAWPTVWYIPAKNEIFGVQKPVAPCFALGGDIFGCRNYLCFFVLNIFGFVYLHEYPLSLFGSIPIFMWFLLYGMWLTTWFGLWSFSQLCCWGHSRRRPREWIQTFVGSKSNINLPLSPDIDMLELYANFWHWWKYIYTCILWAKPFHGTALWALTS